MRHLLALAALAACAPYLKAPDDRRELVDGGALDRELVDRELVDGGALDRELVDRELVDRELVDVPVCSVDLECTLPYRGPSAGILARCVGARCVVLCLPGLAWCDFGMRHRCAGGLCQ